MIGLANKASTVELRQIRSFLSIAETQHFRRTAELIHLSRSALSLQIRALEEEVGVRLLEGVESGLNHVLADERARQIYDAARRDREQLEKTQQEAWDQRKP